MARVALVGLVGSVAEMVAAVLSGEGHEVSALPLDADVIRELGRQPPDAVVFDGHAYANTRVFLSALRDQESTSHVGVVLIGPERPAEVPQFDVVHQVGRTLDLDALLTAVRRALGQLGD